MEEKKDGIISVEAEKIIPMTKGEWKEFQKQMRMEGDYFYMVGNKKYVHYDGEDYLRMEDYRQELDKAREEVLLELLEKKTNYNIKEVGHGYKVTQEYVLVSDIEKELSKLKSKK